MTITKTEVISVRVPLDINAGLALAAEAERRRLAYMHGALCSGSAEPMGTRSHQLLGRSKARLADAGDE